MINSPLKLRLRIVPAATLAIEPSVWALRAGYTAPIEHSRDYDPYAILEFENPLNGSWHPVEVYEDAEKQKPPEGG
jgi:hypothetical protein